MRRESTIPSRYEILDYVRTISAAVDTGISMTGTTLKIELDYKKTNTKAYSCFWGASDSDTKWCANPYFNQSTALALYIGSSAAVNTSYISINQRRVYSVEINKSNHTFSVNNNGSVSIGSWSGNISTNNIFLFGQNQGDNHITQTITLDCFGCQITLDGVLVRDYVPAKDTVTGLYGLYDNCGSICPLTSTPFYIQANRIIGGNL